MKFQIPPIQQRSPTLSQLSPGQWFVLNGEVWIKGSGHECWNTNYCMSPETGATKPLCANEEVLPVELVSTELRYT